MRLTITFGSEILPSHLGESCFVYIFRVLHARGFSVFADEILIIAAFPQLSHLIQFMSLNEVFQINCTFMRATASKINLN